MVSPAYIVQVPSMSNRAGRAKMAGGNGAAPVSLADPATSASWLGEQQRRLKRKARRQRSSPRNIPAAWSRIGKSFLLFRLLMP